MLSVLPDKFKHLLNKQFLFLGKLQILLYGFPIPFFQLIAGNGY